jgi:hypothetical protein
MSPRDAKPSRILSIIICKPLFLITGIYHIRHVCSEMEGGGWPSIFILTLVKSQCRATCSWIWTLYHRSSSQILLAWLSPAISNHRQVSISDHLWLWNFFHTVLLAPLSWCKLTTSWTRRAMHFVSLNVPMNSAKMITDDDTSGGSHGIFVTTWNDLKIGWFQDRDL